MDLSARRTLRDARRENSRASVLQNRKRLQICVRCGERPMWLDNDCLPCVLASNPDREVEWAEGLVESCDRVLLYFPGGKAKAHIGQPVSSSIYFASFCGQVRLDPQSIFPKWQMQINKFWDVAEAVLKFGSPKEATCKVCLKNLRHVLNNLYADDTTNFLQWNAKRTSCATVFALL